MSTLYSIIKVHDIRYFIERLQNNTVKRKDDHFFNNDHPF